MRFCYADPPYFGMGEKMYKRPEWDLLETHHALVRRLMDEFPDGWAMSCSSTSLLKIGAACPEARVAAWTKPWASMRPNVSPAFAWEPVLFMGGRRASRTEWSGRDYIHCSITHGRSVKGAKPDGFSFWLFEDLFHATPDDEFVDLFLGSGAVTRAWETWCGMRGRMVCGE